MTLRAPLRSLVQTFREAVLGQPRCMTPSCQRNTRNRAHALCARCEWRLIRNDDPLAADVEDPR